VNSGSVEEVIGFEAEGVEAVEKEAAFERPSVLDELVIGAPAEFEAYDQSAGRSIASVGVTIDQADLLDQWGRVLGRGPEIETQDEYYEERSFIHRI